MKIGPLLDALPDASQAPDAGRTPGPAWRIARNTGVWADCCKAILQKVQR